MSDKQPTPDEMIAKAEQLFGRPLEQREKEEITGRDETPYHLREGGPTGLYQWLPHRPVR